MTSPALVVFLRQVDSASWCVTIRRKVDGSFIERLATARPYPLARDVAQSAGRDRGLRIVIQGDAVRRRLFNPVADRDEPGGRAAAAGQRRKRGRA